MTTAAPPKKERLDRILLRLGYVDVAQVSQALTRQRSRGGRLGSHLLHYGFLSEAQLAEALSQQFGVPGVMLSELEIAKSALKKLPVETVEEVEALPFRWEVETRTLHVAMIDPSKAKRRVRIKNEARARRVEVYVAPEAVVLRKIALHYRTASSDLLPEKTIELPSLFEEEPAVSAEESGEVDGEALDATEDFRRVLVVTRATFLKNLLGSILEREGCDVTFVSEQKEMTGILNETTFDRILVSRDSADEVSRWVKEGKVTTSGVETSIFDSVSGALLDNPAPYRKIVASYLQSLKFVAHFLCMGAGWKPHHGRICSDIRALAGSFGMGRLAADGLQIAAHLLIPPPRPEATDPFGAVDTKARPFADFEKVLEVARSLRFPWDLESVLQTVWEIGSGRPPERIRQDRNQEIELGAQILGLVWTRHVWFREAADEEEIDRLKEGLRSLAGQTASGDVVEAYIRMLDRAGKEKQLGVQNQVLIVSRVNDVAGRFQTLFEGEGIRTLLIQDLAEAQSLCQRVPPTVILVDHDEFPEHTADFGRLHEDASGSLLYAFMRKNNQARILELMEAGYDEVLVPPFNFEIFSTRVMKALESRAENQSGTSQQGFSASFDAFSFVDLIQALAGSQKSVCIDLAGPEGAEATIYMKNGVMIHAVSGPLTGCDAVYRVIAWGPHGSFSAEPVTEFPEPNIFETNDSIILEGCRLLDETAK